MRPLQRRVSTCYWMKWNAHRDIIPIHTPSTKAGFIVNEIICRDTMRPLPTKADFIMNETKDTLYHLEPIQRRFRCAIEWNETRARVLLCTKRKYCAIMRSLQRRVSSRRLRITKRSGFPTLPTERISRPYVPHWVGALRVIWYRYLGPLKHIFW